MIGIGLYLRDSLLKIWEIYKKCSNSISFWARKMFFFLMGQNFTRNWLVPLSGCYSGTYVHSPAQNIDKDTYELSVTSEPSVPPPPIAESSKTRFLGQDWDRDFISKSLYDETRPRLFFLQFSIPRQDRVFFSSSQCWDDTEIFFSWVSMLRRDRDFFLLSLNVEARLRLLYKPWVLSFYVKNMFTPTYFSTYRKNVKLSCWSILLRKLGLWSLMLYWHQDTSTNPPQ